MKKPARVLGGTALVLLVVVGGIIANNKLPIATGYAAKNMCSCVFIASRPQSEIQSQDLNFSLVRYTKSSVDKANKVVTSSLFGLFKRKAVYRPGFGCSLVFDREISQRKKNPELDCGSSHGFPAPSNDSPGIEAQAFPYQGNLKVDLPRLQSVIQSKIDETSPEGIHLTRTIAVLHQGKFIAEAYAPGFDSTTLQLGWSMSKSVTNAIAGLLVREGKLSLDMPAPIPAWQGDDRAKITIRNLLQQTPGLEWEEQYMKAADVTKMLYRHPSKSAYAIAKPLANTPGETWVYSSGTTNILSHILMQQFPDADAFICHVNQHLFRPAGLNSMVMETDASDEVIGSSYTYATARDWARFGQLFLQDGTFNGDRILPEGWAGFTTQPSRGSDGTYGAQFWLNASGRFPDVPESMYFAEGFQGQRVYILPSHELVVVRLALSSEFDENLFLREILDCFDGDHPEGMF